MAVEVDLICDLIDQVSKERKHKNLIKEVIERSRGELEDQDVIHDAYVHFKDPRREEKVRRAAFPHHYMRVGLENFLRDRLKHYKSRDTIQLKSVIVGCKVLLFVKLIDPDEDLVSVNRSLQTHPEANFEVDRLSREVVDLFDNPQVRSAISDTFVLAGTLDVDEEVLLDTIELYSGEEDRTYPIREAFEVRQVPPATGTRAVKRVREFFHILPTKKAS